MKITIDTREDSNEDIMHAIALLERYVSAEKAYVESRKKEEKKDFEPSALAGFASMMGAAESSEQKTEVESDEDDDETPKIVEYS